MIGFPFENHLRTAIAVVSSCSKCTLEHVLGDRRYRTPPETPSVNHAGAQGEAHNTKQDKQSDIEIHRKMQLWLPDDVVGFYLL